MKRLQRLRIFSLLACISVGLFLAAMGIFLKFDIRIATIAYLAMAVILFAAFYFHDIIRQESRGEVEENLDKGIKDALSDARVGILVYNEDLEITWMSSVLTERSHDHLGERLLAWIPEVHTVLEGTVEEVTVIINEEKYAVSKKKNANVLTFRDISKQYDLEKRFKEDAVVIGMVNFDNYDEVSELEDDLAYFNSTLRPTVYDYFRAHQLVYKTLRNNRVYLVLNEKKYVELLEDRFSVLNTLRREAKKGDIEMTLSMAFARGSEDLQELDALASNLLEIAQTRGGDQVVSRRIGEDAVFYGGSSEAKGKRSKVRVRVYANTLKDLFSKASNVIICGHQEADADCIGAALCMSAIARTYVPETCIISRSGGVEATTAEILKNYNEELEKRHEFVTEGEALNRLRDDTLVIMVDHHSASQSNGSNLLKKAKKIVIIDHHRRKADLDTDPIPVYIEAAASSACELSAEFLPYLLKKTPLTNVEANLMYLGMIIDTNHFRVRTGERTFDVARLLKQYGADPAECEEWIKEPFAQVRQISHIVQEAKLYTHGIAVAAIDDDEVYARSIISQACDRLLSVKEVAAGFVIAHIGEEEMAISARSDGSINVQLIMEKMKGGGHLTGAGVQRKEGTITSLREELEKAIAEYIAEEEKENESHSAE